MDLATVSTITPGAGLTLNFFLKCNPTKCLATITKKIAVNVIIKKVFNFVDVVIFLFKSVLCPGTVVDNRFFTTYNTIC